MIIHCLPDCAWAEGNLEEAAGQQGNMLEHSTPPNPTQVHDQMKHPVAVVDSLHLLSLKLSHFPHLFVCHIVLSSNNGTGWGGHLFRRFCNLFSKSSPCLLGLHGSCSIAQQPVELSENSLQNLRNKWPPHPVGVVHGACSFVSLTTNLIDINRTSRQE